MNQILGIYQNNFYLKILDSRINNKILIIQAKIYHATKNYDLNNIKKLQSYLFKSQEARIFSLKSLAKGQYIYNYINQRKYFISEYNQKLILNILYTFEKQHNKYIDVLLTKMKHYKMYLCIKPNWQAKLSKIKIVHNLNFLYKRLCNDQIFTNKEELIFDVRKKIESLSGYKNLSQELILNTDYYINCMYTCNISNFYINKKVNDFYYKLYEIFINLILLNSTWYYFFLKKACISIKISSRLIKNFYIEQKNIYRLVYHNIKSIIYSKNLHNKSKFKMFLSIKTCINIIVNNFLLICNNFFLPLNNNHVQNYYSILNLLLYLIYKRKNKNIFLKQLKKLHQNRKVHIFFYCCKIKENYFYYS